MRILVVEDEPKMAGLIRRVLVAERHVVDVAPDGVTALGLADGPAYDVIVLDRMLPDVDGLTVLRLLRPKGVATPVLLLTALGSVEERVAGLDAGADDYLPKPFSFAELVARIRALGRRPAGASGRATSSPATSSSTSSRHAAQVGDRSVDLSAREFALLGYLIRQRRPGRHPAPDPRRRLGLGARRLLERRRPVRPLPPSQARANSVGPIGCGRSEASATRCGPSP